MEKSYSKEQIHILDQFHVVQGKFHVVQGTFHVEQGKFHVV